MKFQADSTLTTDGANDPKFNWVILSKLSLVRMPSKTNKREALVKQEAEKLGWEVLDKGWPDYLFWDKWTNTAILVEVKSCTDTVKKHQRKIHNILKSCGLNVVTLPISKSMLYSEKGRLKLVEKIWNL